MSGCRRHAGIFISFLLEGQHCELLSVVYRPILTDLSSLAETMILPLGRERNGFDIARVTLHMSEQLYHCRRSRAFFSSGDMSAVVRCPLIIARG
jgi:hypothetical protein